MWKSYEKYLITYTVLLHVSHGNIEIYFLLYLTNCHNVTPDQPWSSGDIFPPIPKANENTTYTGHTPPNFDGPFFTKNLENYETLYCLQLT